MKHELKTWAGGFQATLDGTKRHEVRKEDDRTFRVGDILYLREWNSEKAEYTGRALEAEVSYISRGADWYLPDGVVVMSIDVVSDVIEGSYPASQDDPTVTLDLLSLVDVEVPLEVISAWSPEQRHQADEWAGATCLAASDNEGVVIPPTPGHIEQYIKRHGS